MSAVVYLVSLLLVSAATPASQGGTPPSPPAAAGEHKSVITSDKLDVDREKNIAVFTGNVHVVDPEGEMWADRMTAYFEEGSRRIKKLVCTGEKVIIKSRGKTSVSRKAVYTANDGRIVLTGNPRIRHGKNSYGADKITIFKDSDRTIFEPRARLILYSDEGTEDLNEIP